jgi:choloylglycine hydrolase
MPIVAPWSCEPLASSEMCPTILRVDGGELVQNTAKAVKTAFHLLNNFDLPPGSNNPPAATAESYSDYTVSDLKNLQFHWKTFDDQRVRFIDLNKVLAKAGSESLTMEMGDQSQEDVGDQLK